MEKREKARDCKKRTWALQPVQAPDWYKPHRDIFRSSLPNQRTTRPVGQLTSIIEPAIHTQIYPKLTPAKLNLFTGRLVGTTPLVPRKIQRRWGTMLCARFYRQARLCGREHTHRQYIRRIISKHWDTFKQYQSSLPHADFIGR